MKYKAILFLRFFTGFIFYACFFIGSYNFIITSEFPVAYVISFVSAMLYLYFSYLVSHFNMHYFFEFIKELILKVTLIATMFGFALFVYFVFPAVINSGKKGMIFVVFFTFYIAFDFISEVAIISTSYRRSVDFTLYYSKMTQNQLKYIKLQEEDPLLPKIDFEKRYSKFRQFISRYLQVCVYDCFIDHEGKCYGVFDKAFYMKLIEFSKENQRFFSKKLSNNTDYILDCRCNVVCIREGIVTFFDHNGTKCVFTSKIKNYYL